jgi:hypothetical protein
MANQDQFGGGCAFVRADVDSFTGKWIGIYNAGSGGDQGYTGKRGDSSVPVTGGSQRPEVPSYRRQDSIWDFFRCLTSQQDGRANLLPLLSWVLRDGTTTGLSLLGAPPFVFYTRGVGSGFSNAQEYPIGGTTYKMFPNFAIVKQ